MIHLFDGFTWPSNKQLNPYDSTVISNFTFPSSSSTTGEFVSSGEGNVSVAGLNLNGRGYRIVSKKTVPTSPVLVVGMRAKYPSNASRSTWGAAIGFTFSTNSTPIYAGNNTGVPSNMPGFIVGRHTTSSQNGLCLSAVGQSVQYVANQNLIVSGSYQPLTGIDMGESHMYEAEYRLNENIINIYVDGIKLVEVPFTFTAAQKAASYVMTIHGISDNDACASTLECVYLADTRLGPVRVVSKRATSDVSADSVFGAGPHTSKINTTSDGTSRMITKATGDALFNLNGTVNSDVQAINMLGRFSTKHASAQETEATAGFNLMGGSGVWKSPKQSIPSASFRQDILLLEQNPVTNQKWTQSEINAMQAGFGIEVRDRYPS